MRVQKKKKKAFAYRGPIGDYNYLQCTILINSYDIYSCLIFPGHAIGKKRTKKDIVHGK